MARIHRMFPEYFAKQRMNYRNQLYKETWLWKRSQNQVNTKIKEDNLRSNIRYPNRRYQNTREPIDDMGLTILLIGFLFFIIGFIALFFFLVPGLIFILISSIFLLPFYWSYFYKPKIEYREFIEERRRNQEELKEREERLKRELEDEKRKYQDELRIKYGDLFLSVVDTIKKFEQLLPEYPNELSYHIDLARWLEPKYPMLHVEHQEGSSRPDIVIEDIAIEIKGPTTEEGLRSIADKCLRYHHHFKRMIVVLFDIRTKTDRYYIEWEDGLKRHFPDVIVIKK